jgi:hypothetical protein
MVLVILIVRMVDPILIVLALVGGGVSRLWWHVAAAALVVALIVEMLLFSIQRTRMFDPLDFVIGVIAAGIWTSIAFTVKRWLARRAKSA